MFGVSRATPPTTTAPGASAAHPRYVVAHRTEDSRTGNRRSHGEEWWLAETEGSEPLAAEDRPLAAFAGIWTEFKGDRGTKSKPIPGPHLVYGFLTTSPNAVVEPIHPKAMPVI
jgi:hypothetical protein